MYKIGHSLPAGDEAFRWDNLSTTGGTEYVYDEDTGMEYEFAHDLGILAISHDGVGLVTYYRATADEFDSLIDAGN